MKYEVNGIRFMKHFVADANGNKARVVYSHGTLRNGQECVTIYAKDYGHELDCILPDVENDTDTMTDYFDKSKARIYPNTPFYEVAYTRATEK